MLEPNNEIKDTENFTHFDRSTEVKDGPLDVGKCYSMKNNVQNHCIAQHVHSFYM